MRRILVSASFSEALLARQTPRSSGVWEDFQFLFSPSAEPLDGWVVLDNLQYPIEQSCPLANTMLITGEPESVRRYRTRFTSQFGQVWTSHAGIRHPHRFQRNEAQHWHYAMRRGPIHGHRLEFDELVALQRPLKPKALSVVCSDKALTPDHRQRLEFVELLKTELGDAVDVFGRGVRPMEDKSEAIWPYKYHIVLENDHSPYFMTEKISDAFLGWSYPIYFGGSEAHHRFPEGSFTAIDIYQPDQAIAIIRDVIAAETYETAQSITAQARQAVLYRNNLFAMLVEHYRSNLAVDAAQPVRLLPKSHRADLVMRQVGRIVGRTMKRSAA